MWDRKASGGFEHKITGFKRLHLQVVGVSVVVIVFFLMILSAKSDPNFSVKFQRNQLFFPRICLSKFHIMTLFCDLPEALVMYGLRNKSSWSGRLFLSLSPPTFFPSQTSIMSNLDQSYFKKSEGLNYIRSVKEWTKCMVGQGFDRTKPFYDHTFSIDQPLFEALMFLSSLVKFAHSNGPKNLTKHFPLLQ